MLTWDARAFTFEETRLIEQAGKPCPVGAIIYIKADLLEFGPTFGFWTTGASAHPCFVCRCHKHNMLNLDQWDAITHPFGPTTFAQYEEDLCCL